jgi:hypothetical protein
MHAIALLRYIFDIKIVFRCMFLSSTYIRKKHIHMHKFVLPWFGMNIRWLEYRSKSTIHSYEKKDSLTHICFYCSAIYIWKYEERLTLKKMKSKMQKEFFTCSYEWSTSSFDKKVSSSTHKHRTSNEDLYTKKKKMHSIS